jgi:hypothetical protein
MSNKIILSDNSNYNDFRQNFLLKQSKTSVFESRVNRFNEIVRSIEDLKKENNSIRFSPDILIIEDNFNQIIDYFNTFFSINSNLKILACTNDDTIKFCLKNVINDFSTIRIVIFDFNLDGGLDNHYRESLNALRRYKSIKNKLNHKYKLYGFTGFKYEIKVGNHYYKLQSQIGIDGHHSFSKSKLHEDSSFLKNLYNEASLNHNPESKVENLGANFNSSKIRNGKKYLLNIEKGIAELINLRKIDINSAQESDINIRTIFQDNLHKYTKKK